MTVWDLMVGQPRAVEVLKSAAEEARAITEGNEADAKGALSHAWLITGPPGSGRSIAGRALAAALQCTGETVGCGVSLARRFATPSTLTSTNCTS